jgi:hypothetical protein
MKDTYISSVSQEINTIVDNVIEWEVNSSPVIVEPSDAYRVEFEEPAVYNSDNIFATITAKVFDQFDNPII